MSNLVCRTRFQRLLPAAALLTTCAVFALAFDAAAELAPSAQKAKPLDVGASVPSVVVQTPAGERVSLEAMLAGKPTVLVFYRGGWCPFCLRHLGDLQTARPELRRLGFQILAISADPPEALRPTVEESALGYTLLSDHDMQASGAFGLAFAVDEETLEKYAGYGITLSARHQGRFWLPVPAVYLVDVGGRIVFRHVDPDYKRRIAMPVLLDEAARAAGEDRS